MLRPTGWRSGRRSADARLGDLRSRRGARWWARRALTQARSELVADAGAVPGASAVRMVGQVEATAPLTSPLGGQPCVYYGVVVEERPGDRARSSVRIRDTAWTVFSLRDASGVAMVDPRGARVATAPRVTASGPFDRPDAREAAFLAAHGFASRRRFFHKNLRYIETIVAVGARVAVLGAAVRDADPEAAARVVGYRELPPTRALLSSGRDAPLVISDDPRVLGAAVALIPATGETAPPLPR